jgi:type IV secretion system protein VirB2
MTKFNTKALLKALVLLAVLFLPQIVMAGGGGAAGGGTATFDCTKAGATIVSFFSSVEGLLGVASIIIVTIAIIFAGYQIAFAHKRLSDVAPVLVGGLMIGAAGAIATMLMGSSVAGKC